MPSTPVHMRVDTDLLAELDARAADIGVSRTALVHLAVREWLKDVATHRPKGHTVSTEPVATESPLLTGRVDVATPEESERSRTVATVPLAEGLLEDVAATPPTAIGPSEVACRHPLVRRVGRTCLDCDARVT